MSVVVCDGNETGITCGDVCSTGVLVCVVCVGAYAM